MSIHNGIYSDLVKDGFGQFYQIDKDLISDLSPSWSQLESNFFAAYLYTHLVNTAYLESKKKTHLFTFEKTILEICKEIFDFGFGRAEYDKVIRAMNKLKKFGYIDTKVVLQIDTLTTRITILKYKKPTSFFVCSRAIAKEKTPLFACFLYEVCVFVDNRLFENRKHHSSFTLYDSDQFEKTCYFDGVKKEVISFMKKKFVNNRGFLLVLDSFLNEIDNCISYEFITDIAPVRMDFVPILIDNYYITTLHEQKKHKDRKETKKLTTSKEIKKAKTT